MSDWKDEVIERLAQALRECDQVLRDNNPNEYKARSSIRAAFSFWQEMEETKAGSE